MRGFVLDGDKFWYIGYDQRVLISFSDDDFETVVIPESIVSYYSDGIAYKDYICFAPGQGSNMLIYSKTTDKILKVPVGSNSSYGELLFDSMLFVNDRVFLVPFKYFALTEYNVSTRELKIHHKEFGELYSKYKCLFRRACLIDNKYIIMPHAATNVLVKYNVNTEKMDFIVVNGCISLSDVCVIGDKLYVLASDPAKVIVMDLKNYEIIKTIDLGVKDAYAFHCLVSCGAYLFIMQREAKKSVRMNTNNGEMDFFNVFSNSPMSANIVLYAKAVGDASILFSHKMNRGDYLGKLDANNLTVTWLRLPSRREIYSKIPNSMKGKLTENEGISLSDFISAI